MGIHPYYAEEVQEEESVHRQQSHVRLFDVRCSNLAVTWQGEPRGEHFVVHMI
jgi:hypothetical protein